MARHFRFRQPAPPRLDHASLQARDLQARDLQARDLQARDAGPVHSLGPDEFNARCGYTKPYPFDG